MGGTPPQAGVRPGGGTHWQPGGTPPPGAPPPRGPQGGTPLAGTRFNNATAATAGRVLLALRFAYSPTALLPLLPAVRLAIAAAASLPPESVNLTVRGAEPPARRLLLPSQRRLAQAAGHIPGPDGVDAAGSTADTTVDVAVRVQSAAAAAAAAGLTGASINTQLQARGVQPASIVSPPAAAPPDDDAGPQPAAPGAPSASPAEESGAGSAAGTGGAAGAPSLAIGVGGALGGAAAAAAAVFVLRSRRQVRVARRRKVAALPFREAWGAPGKGAGRPGSPDTAWVVGPAGGSGDVLAAVPVAVGSDMPVTVVCVSNEPDSEPRAGL